jgi:nitrogenase-associated protein
MQRWYGSFGKGVYMAIIRFFEKPNCTGNARQKAILTAAGHTLITENLIDFPFTAELLRSFFTGLPVTQWFNPMSPRITSGEIDITAMNEDQAIGAMLQDHLLIRRPLLEINGKRIVGFSIETLEAMEVHCSANPRLVLLGVKDLEGCPGHAMGIKCDEIRNIPGL